MKRIKKARTIQLPEWIDTAVVDLAHKNKRTISGQVEFLVEEALKAEFVNPGPVYTDRNPAPHKEVVGG